MADRAPEPRVIVTLDGMGVEALAPAEGLEDLDECLSCGRSDRPMIVQVSGAYALCARCQSIAEREMEESPHV
jgi:hypothetical protein